MGKSRADHFVKIAIAKTPRWWKPAAWDDVPPRCTLIELAERKLDEAQAEGWIYGFNGKALKDAERTLWAVAIPANRNPGVGHVCRRLIPMCA